MNKENQQEWFAVIQLHRDDIRAEHYNPDALTDDDMRILADKIQDAIMSTGVYWDVISDYCQHENLPALKED